MGKGLCGDSFPSTLPFMGEVKISSWDIGVIIDAVEGGFPTANPASMRNQPDRKIGSVEDMCMESIKIVLCQNFAFFLKISVVFPRLLWGRYFYQRVPFARLLPRLIIIDDDRNRMLWIPRGRINIHSFV